MKKSRRAGSVVIANRETVKRVWRVNNVEKGERAKRIKVVRAGVVKSGATYGSA